MVGGIVLAWLALHTNPSWVGSLYILLAVDEWMLHLDAREIALEERLCAIPGPSVRWCRRRQDELVHCLL